jgi:ATP-dependent helicase HrpB
MVVGAGADAALACIVAALVDERDVLRGPPNDLPVDLAMRVGLVADRETHHPRAGAGAVARIRDTARDVARRAGVTWGDVDPAHTGKVLALAYPDRLALRRGSPGRFHLRRGSTAWMSDSDPLAPEQFLVVADLDGKRKDARIRLAAAIGADDVIAAFHHEVDAHTTLLWEGEKLVSRTEQKLGGLVLKSHDERPQPSPATAAALVSRLADRNLTDLTWTDSVEALTSRVGHLHRKLGHPWPDWSRQGLARSVDDWLAGPLTLATGIDDLQIIDVRRLLLAQLGHGLVGELDRLAPSHVQIPSGRRVAIDYSADVPVVAVRVQEMFGSTRTPTVAGIPVRLELLSPAGRPVQITQDLAGFWVGSWREVRKEMAGRYPKHDWPEDPASAKPSRR